MIDGRASASDSGEDVESPPGEHAVSAAIDAAPASNLNNDRMQRDTERLLALDERDELAGGKDDERD